MNERYQKDIEDILELPLSWEKLDNKTIFITGATGLIGKAIIDIIMYRNKYKNSNCKIIATSRKISNIKEKFTNYIGNENFVPFEYDVNNLLNINERIDYIINSASNTHPKSYANMPIQTILTNILGLNNLLLFASKNKIQRFVEVTTLEVYGKIDTFNTLIKEDDSGYINCNTLRAGYPESKRVAEALCNAYYEEFNLDFVIARPSRCYGPTVLKDDSKATSQFIRKGLANENIILKSLGNQVFSYCYMMDAASGILAILLNGEVGEAYNITDDKSVITLGNLAKEIAKNCGVKVVRDIPEEVEAKGFSNSEFSVLDTTKLKNIGWKSYTDIYTGINKTINILK
ncbi:NAD-dependent epimerase/dehydratase family protein [Clostridium botulinum]|nr:NAD-dependent epimerase/dehydratase family protein [Clostridium botulinum]